MREVSGTTWSFQLIILFILIFACFLSLVVNYFHAYRARNDMLTIIEKYEGITNGDKNNSLKIINNVLKDNGYKTVGACTNEEGNWMGALDLEGNVEKAKEGVKYYYCFQKVSRGDGSWNSNNTYYNIKVFYRFNLPVLGQLATFVINGRTNSFVGNQNSIS